MSIADGSRLGSYRILRKLGEGRTGEVYQAIHVDSQQCVALKLLHSWCIQDAMLVEKFINAARRMQRLAQVGFVQVTDLGQEPGSPPFFAMEFLEGETLAARQRRLGPGFPMQELLWLASQAAALIASAQKQKIICQPMTPDVFMIRRGADESGRESIKFLDLFVDTLSPLVDRNRMGTVTYSQHAEAAVFYDFHGTAAYLPPELCRDPNNLHEKNDVYSLGIILYQLIVGQLPFDDKIRAETLAMHLTMPPPPIARFARTVPPPLVELVNQMLAKRMTDRPPMAHVAQVLKDIESRYV